MMLHVNTPLAKLIEDITQKAHNNNSMYSYSDLDINQICKLYMKHEPALFNEISGDIYWKYSNEQKQDLVFGDAEKVKACQAVFIRNMWEMISHEILELEECFQSIRERETRAEKQLNRFKIINDIRGLNESNVVCG